MDTYAMFSVSCYRVENLEILRSVWSLFQATDFILQHPPPNIAKYRTNKVPLDVMCQCL